MEIEFNFTTVKKIFNLTELINKNTINNSDKSLFVSGNDNQIINAIIDQFTTNFKSIAIIEGDRFREFDTGFFEYIEKKTDLILLRNLHPNNLPTLYEFIKAFRKTKRAIRFLVTFKSITPNDFDNVEKYHVKYFDSVCTLTNEKQKVTHAIYEY